MARLCDGYSSDEGVVGGAVGSAEREAEECMKAKTQTQPVVPVPVHARNAIPIPQVP